MTDVQPEVDEASGPERGTGPRPQPPAPALRPSG